LSLRSIKIDLHTFFALFEPLLYRNWVVPSKPAFQNKAAKKAGDSRCEMETQASFVSDCNYYKKPFPIVQAVTIGNTNVLNMTVKAIQRKIEGLPPLSETADIARFDPSEEQRISKT
jgi:hypothetical protein